MSAWGILGVTRLCEILRQELGGFGPVAAVETAGEAPLLPSAGTEASSALAFAKVETGCPAGSGGAETEADIETGWP